MLILVNSFLQQFEPVVFLRTAFEFFLCCPVDRIFPPFTAVGLDPTKQPERIGKFFNVF